MSNNVLKAILILAVFLLCIVIVLEVGDADSKLILAVVGAVFVFGLIGTLAALAQGTTEDIQKQLFTIIGLLVGLGGGLVGGVAAGNQAGQTAANDVKDSAVREVQGQSSQVQKKLDQVKGIAESTKRKVGNQQTGGGGPQQ